VLRNGGLQLEGQKRPGKARERRGEWLTTIMTAIQEMRKKKRKRGGGTGEEGPGSAQHAKIGRGGYTNRHWHGRSARE
jgi:hypothetical protein